MQLCALPVFWIITSRDRSCNLICECLVCETLQWRNIRCDTTWTRSRMIWWRRCSSHHERTIWRFCIWWCKPNPTWIKSRMIVRSMSSVLVGRKTKVKRFSNFFVTQDQYHIKIIFIPLSDPKIILFFKSFFILRYLINLVK